MNEQQMKIFFGWTGSSTMAGTYVHMSGKQLDSAFLKSRGMELESPKAEIKARVCPRCKYPNGTDVRYCGICGSPLDLATAMQMDKDTNNVGYALTEAIQKGDLNSAIEGLSQLVLKADYEKKKRRK